MTGVTIPTRVPDNVLIALPQGERLAFLENVVVAEIKRVLLMPDDEELPFEETFFELGLTSLALSDVRQAIETQLRHSFSSTVMFNCPTVEQLLDYLLKEMLPEATTLSGVDRTS